MAVADSTGNALLGQVAVVTGSTQGIGGGIARKLAACGMHVVVHGLEHQREGGERIVASIEAAGGQALLLTGDLQDESHCRSIVRDTLARFGRVDVLVNNAGVVHRGTIEDTRAARWDEIFAVNVRAPFLLCQEVVRHMKERQSGCIVNIGSTNAHCGAKNLLPYSASKGALMTLTRNLANYLTQYRIRVNLVNPGWVLTEGEQHVQAVIEGKGENWLAGAIKTRPFGRMLRPDDIANAVVFFATNETISGAVLDYEQIPTGAPSD